MIYNFDSEIDRVESKYNLSDDEDEPEEQVYEWEEVVVNGRSTNNNVKEDKPVQHPQVKSPYMINTEGTA